jgi:hypothetical protein
MNTGKTEDFLLNDPNSVRRDIGSLDFAWF